MADIFDTVAKQDVFDTVAKQDIFDRVAVLDPDKPIDFVEDHIPPVDIPGIADPRDVTIAPVEAPEVPSDQQFFRQAPERTSWQNFKRFFTGDRPPLPPNAERMEKFDRVFDIAIGTPLRVFLKFSKGKTLNLPDLVWAGIKKITPDSTWTEEVKKMNLDQAMDWAAGHDPSGFEEMIGGLAEFMGRLGTAKQIGQATGVLGTKATLPKDITKLIRAGEAAKLFGLAAAGEQFSKLAAETIDPQTDYQYEGAMGVLKDMGIGAGLSLAVSTIAEPALAKTAQSAIGKKIIESANRAMIEFSKRFPQLADAFRKNPRQEFIKMTEDAMRARGLKPTEFTAVQKAYVRNVAREFERRYIIAFRNYKPTPDIVTRGPGRRGLQLATRTARDTKAIEFVRNALRQEQFAALDEKTRAEIGQRMLAEQGVDVELEELAEIPPTVPSKVLETSEQMSDRLEEQYGNNVVIVDHGLLFGKTDKRFNEIVDRMDKLFEPGTVNLREGKTREYENLLIQKLEIIEEHLSKAEPIKALAPTEKPETPATVPIAEPQPPIQPLEPPEAVELPQKAAEAKPEGVIPAREARAKLKQLNEQWDKIQDTKVVDMPELVGKKGKYRTKKEAISDISAKIKEVRSRQEPVLVDLGGGRDIEVIGYGATTYWREAGSKEGFGLASPNFRATIDRAIELQAKPPTEAKPEALEDFQKTQTNLQAANLGFTKADQAVIAYIESRGAQVNISGVPLEEWFTYRTPEGLLIQSDAEIIGKGGYPELRTLAEKWLALRKAKPEAEAAGVVIAKKWKNQKTISFRANVEASRAINRYKGIRVAADKGRPPVVKSLEEIQSLIDNAEQEHNKLVEIAQQMEQEGFPTGDVALHSADGLESIRRQIRGMPLKTPEAPKGFFIKTTVTEAPAAPERGKRTVAEIQAEIDSLIREQKSPPTELLAEFNAAVKEAKEEPITGKVVTVEKTSDVKTKIPKAPKEPVTESPTIPLKGKEAQVFREEVRTQEKITEAEEGEVGIEPAGASLTDHIDTFHTYQLPSTSKIPKITKEMKRINGLRLAGKLTPQEANNKIYNLRKDVVRAAIKEKIAIRVSKKGKVKIALRQSGVFVPEEVATYKKYKDIEPILGGGQDITRAIQQMDGSLSIKEKLKVKGQAGPIERFVLWRTRKMSLQKLNWLKEKTIEIRGILSAPKGSIKDKEINIILEQIGSADRDLPIKDVLDKKTFASMSKESIKAAQELRQFYDDMIEEQNAARLMRGQAEIPYRQNYSPNILRDTTVWEQLFLRGQTAKILEKRDLPDYIKPNAPFNPRAQAREAKIPYDKRVLSARELAESYIVTASKDIFNTSIIQNNKAFIDQLKGQGLEKSAEYLAEWTATSYAGIKPRLDRAIKLPKWAAGSLRYFNRLRNLAVFPLNVAWSLSTQPLSLSNTIGRYGLPNTVRGFFQWLKPSVRKQAAQDYFSFIVKTTKRGGVTKQDASNLLGENIKTQKTVGEFVENFTTILLTEMEKLLTGTSIRAAHITGLKKGLKGEALKQFASDGGGKTQSMYNDEDKPMILRSLLVKSAAPYQTYAFEVANTFREWSGRTGTPPDTKLYAIWSVTRWLAALIVLKMMANTVRGKKWSWWDLIPIPFREFWLTPMIRGLTGEFVPGSAGLPAPVETGTRAFKGLNDVLEEGNWRKLRNEMLKYGPGVFGVPGGVQWARMVDAIIVYSSGGLTDRKGKVMFEMKDPEDLARAIFTGVWTTEAGKKKLEPKETKEPDKFKFGKR